MSNNVDKKKAVAKEKKLTEGKKTKKTQKKGEATQKSFEEEGETQLAVERDKNWQWVETKLAMGQDKTGSGQRWRRCLP